MDDLTQYSEPISAVVQILLFGIWAVYLHLIYVNYRNTNRPRLILHHSQPISGEAVLLVSNLSERPVEIEAILAVIESQEKRFTTMITQYRQVDRNSNDRLEPLLSEGPLGPGISVSLGSVDALLSQAERGAFPTGQHELQPVDGLRKTLKSCEIRVVGFYAWRERPFAAKRRFDCMMNNAGNLRFKAASVRTDHLIDRSGRKKAEQWLEEARNMAANL